MSSRLTIRARRAPLVLLLLLVFPAVCAAAPARPYPLPPAWVLDQTLYEVNLRNFSATHDVAGLRAQLPRLQQLGVGTVWVMPVHPIGTAGRSGTLGSPYAVKDYKGFNPEFGTVDAFKETVDEAHRLGMFVIIDWVANHTALDHPWVTQHPDWYKRDAAGNLVPPLPEWKDVAALDFARPGVRTAMVDAMAYWVREVGVDGFRCDTAEFVPLDFWVEAHDALRAIKPIFLLAEGVRPDLTAYAFDASYAWNLPENMVGLAKGGKTVGDLVSYINADARDLAAGGFRLNFTSNHDKNAWEGTTREQLGDAADAFAVLTFTLPGMPLIFNGQENGVETRQAFFDHDPIQWRDGSASAKLYRKLADLKRDHRALWADNGAPVEVLAGSTTEQVLTFRRETAGDRVTVMLNLSGEAQRVAAPDGNGSVALGAWEHRVWAGD